MFSEIIILEKEINKRRLLITGLLDALIGILTFFPRWIGIDVGFWGISGTLLDVGDPFNTINEYIELDAANIIVLIVYGLLAFSAVAIIGHFFFIFKSYKSNKDYLTAKCFVCTAILPVFLIVFSCVVNKYISSETDGWLSHVIVIKSAAYLVLLSIAGFLVCRKMPAMIVSTEGGNMPEVMKNLGAITETTMHSVTGKVNSTVDTVKKKVKEKQRRCPSCGQLCTVPDAVFCEKCGAEISPVRLLHKLWKKSAA